MKLRRLLVRQRRKNNKKKKKTDRNMHTINQMGFGPARTEQIDAKNKPKKIIMEIWTGCFHIILISFVLFLFLAESSRGGRKQIEAEFFGNFPTTKRWSNHTESIGFGRRIGPATTQTSIDAWSMQYPNIFTVHPATRHPHRFIERS